jgi:hypothetical protein
MMMPLLGFPQPRAERRSFARRCSRCQVTRYCNADCQRAHWGAHKKVCRRDQRAATRGGSAAPERERDVRPAARGAGGMECVVWRLMVGLVSCRVVW